MKKEQIIWGLILFAVLGAFGGVYQFYFKEKMASYAKDAIAKKNAEDAYSKLNTTFEGFKPDDVIAAWSGVVQPWKDEVLERGKYFNDSGWREGTKPPEDVAILRFWYDKQLKEEVTKIYTDVFQANGLYQVPPMDVLLKEFRVQTLEEYQGRDMTRQDVNRELANLAFGNQICRMMAKAKVSYLSHVYLWPGRELKEHEGLLRFWTVGLEFGMNMRDLVNFVDNNLRTADRYFNIEGIKIQYPYVGYNVEPMLNVQMIVTMARFIENKSGTGDDEALAGVASGANPQSVVTNFGLKNNKTPAAVVEEPTGFAAFWKWFKRNVLFMN
jgi:hypothetical protein